MICIVSEDLNEECNENLKKITDKIIYIKKNFLLYSAIRSHADIQCCPLDNNCLVVHPSIDKETVKELTNRKITVLFGGKKLAYAYPYNITYNAVMVGNKLIHHWQYTDPVIKSEVIKKGYKLIYTKQGYTKCSTLVVDGQSIITSDKGIAKSAYNHDLDVLLIDSGHIHLPGLNYGFIGGASGTLLSEKLIVFNGDIRYHPNFNDIHNFITHRRIEYTCISAKPLIDVGSIFFLTN